MGSLGFTRALITRGRLSDGWRWIWERGRKLDHAEYSTDDVDGEWQEAPLFRASGKLIERTSSLFVAPLRIYACTQNYRIDTAHGVSVATGTGVFVGVGTGGVSVGVGDGALVGVAVGVGGW